MPHGSAKWQIGTLLLAIVAVLPVVALMADAQTKPERDCSLQLVKDGIPSLGPFQSPVEWHPVFSFGVDGKGHVRNVHVVRGTGTASADKKLRKAISKWQYRSQPSCPVGETTISVTIDF